MKCPICGAENVETAEFCKACTNRIPGRLSPHPMLQTGAVVTGILAGSVVGLFMAAMTPYWPGPPYLPAMILVYGLGLVVLLVCQIWTGLFPERMRAHLSPFSVAFTSAYYILLIGYLMILVG